MPASWNDLTTAELTLISKQLLTKYEVPAEARFHILTGIITMRAALQKIKLPGNWLINLNLDDAAIASYNALDYIFTKIELTTNHYPTLKAGKITLQGPNDSFNNITCGEFEDAEIFFIKFRQNNNFSDLQMLTALLWRPPDVPHKDYDAESAVTYHITKIPAHILYINYLWYTGCRNALPLLFPQLFAGGSPVPEPDLTAFTKCIHAGAGPENGTREQIRSMLLKEFAFDMELRITRHKEMERRINSK